MLITIFIISILAMGRDIRDVPTLRDYKENGLNSVSKHTFTFLH
jgi:hypothetical protein